MLKLTLFNILLLTSEVTSETSSEGGQVEETISWNETIIKYIVLLAIIFISLILIALVRRSFKKEASIKKIKSKCDKAKAYALKIKKKNSKQELLIATPKLNKLTSLLSDATWISTRTAEEKKSVILDEITILIDNLASYVGEYAQDTFYSKDDYVKKLDYVIKTIDDIKDRIEIFQKDTSNKN